MKTLLGSVAVSVAMMVGAVSAAHAQSTFEGCGWYAILGCSKSRSGAQRAAGNGFAVIRTNDYPNFRNGWWCAVAGPTSKNSAWSIANDAKRGGVPDAYAKRGC